MDRSIFETTLTILKEIDRVCRKHNIQYWVFFGTLLGAVRHKGFIPWDDDIDLCMKRNDFDRFNEIAKNELGEKFFFQFYDTEKYYDRFVSRVRMNGTTYICHYEKNTVHKYGAIRHMGFFISVFPLDNYVGNEKRFNIQKKFFLFRLRLLQSSMRGDTTFKSSIAKIYCKLAGRANIHKRMHKAFRNVEPDKEGRLIIADIFNEQRKPWIYNSDDFSQTVYLEFESIKVPVPIGYDRILRINYGNYMELPPAEQRKPSHVLFVNPDIDYKDFISNNKEKI